MTVLYRACRRWSKEEIAAIDAAAIEWKCENNGHESAPTMFTLSEWGPRSVAIRGDLESLCLALRRRFAALSSDAQRIPHCELFRGDLKRRRAKTAKSAKVCLVCGAADHFKRRCPHRAETATAKSKGAKKTLKQQKRLDAMLIRLRSVRERKESEAAMLREHETKMENLLCVADALDANALSAAIADIARSFKARKRHFKQSRKIERGAKKAQRREAKREQKQRRKQQKRDRRASLKGVIKSGAFYKKYLKTGDEEMENATMDLMGVDEIGDGDDAKEDIFMVSQRMAAANDTDSGDGVEEGDGDASPDIDARADEMEPGSVHFYASPFAPNDDGDIDGEEDHEFTQIFGEMDEEMDIDDADDFE